MFNKIRKAGEDFTLNSLTSYVADYLAKPGATAEDNKQSGGVAGLALGNMLRGIGIVGTIFSVATMVAVPAGAATIGLLAMGGLYAATGVFGQGMVDGGDKATNFVTGAREVRGEILGDALGELKSWSNKKLGTKFGLAASRDAQVEQLQPAVQPVVVKQPEQKL